MREFILNAVARYLEETGEKSLSVVRRPYLADNCSPKEDEKLGLLQVRHSREFYLKYANVKPVLEGH